MAAIKDDANHRFIFCSGNKKIWAEYHVDGQVNLDLWTKISGIFLRTVYRDLRDLCRRFFPDGYLDTVESFWTVCYPHPY